MRFEYSPAFVCVPELVIGTILCISLITFTVPSYPEPGVFSALFLAKEAKIPLRSGSKFGSGLGAQHCM